MALAYVDTSCLVAIALGEPGSEKLAERLAALERLFASDLVEAEFRATMVREGLGNQGDDLLSWLTWFFPDRKLTREIRSASQYRYVRGADLWHLAAALFLADQEPSQLIFATLDHRQHEVATEIGFRPLSY
ncbi:MAG: PIN domain-containing protein [Acidobacteriota bacterium]